MEGDDLHTKRVRGSQQEYQNLQLIQRILVGKKDSPHRTLYAIAEVLAIHFPYVGRDVIGCHWDHCPVGMVFSQPDFDVASPSGGPYAAGHSVLLRPFGRVTAC